MWVLLIIIAGLASGTFIFVNQASFGKIPAGERLAKIEKAFNYKDGKFQNQIPTEQITTDKSKLGLMLSFLMRKADDLYPKENIPTVKTNLKQLKRDEDVLVWLGHSSLFIQYNGKRFLVDPVLVMASPLSFVNKAFKGTDLYKPEDIPDIDYLIITHDHWDHLDYNTVMKLKNRIGKVICGLGVGEDFEYWGFDKNKIIELNWYEDTRISDNEIIHGLPARHFSGRGLVQNKTLWVSYMLQLNGFNLYLSGDGGYDNHFAEIGKKFDRIDLAVLENGQYNQDWKYIHMMPNEVVKAAKDLRETRLMTIHHSKYALSKHSWKEPLENIQNAADNENLNLITPMIGEVVRLKDSTQKFKKWWK